MDFAKARVASTSFFNSSLLFLIPFSGEYAIFISSIALDTSCIHQVPQSDDLVHYVFLEIMEAMKSISFIYRNKQ